MKRLAGGLHLAGADGGEPPASSPSGHDDADAAGGAYKVLVVEDEMLVALDLRRRLEDLGYDVCGTAATADAAVRIALETRPDLVLMDIKLQGERDGISAAAEIKAKAEPIIVYVTAQIDQVTLERAVTTQPGGFVSKPFSTDVLAAAVARALASRSRARTR